MTKSIIQRVKYIEKKQMLHCFCNFSKFTCLGRHAEEFADQRT